MTAQGSTFRSVTPAVLEAFHRNRALWDAYVERLDGVIVALGLDELPVRFVQGGYGAVRFLIGFRLPIGTPVPDGWVERAKADGVYIPSPTTAAGRVATQLIGGLGDIPSPRQILGQFGMPADIIVDMGVDDPYVEVCSVGLTDDEQAVEVTWPSATIPVDGAYWVQVA